MNKIDAKYYQQNAAKLGWSEDHAVLDVERVALLNQYVVGRQVLDVGCGSGLYVDFLVKQGFEVTGVDLVPQFIKSAKLHRQGKFVVGQADKLPFADKSFDSVILFDILEHGDDRRILAEAKRVARQRILMIVPREVDPELANTGVVFRHYIDKSHIREYSKQLLSELIKQSHLKLVTLQEVHSLNNKIIFLALFRGPILGRDIVRKLVNWVLPYRRYSTELFGVAEVEK